MKKRAIWVLKDEILHCVQNDKTILGSAMPTRWYSRTNKSKPHHVSRITLRRIDLLPLKLPLAGVDDLHVAVGAAELLDYAHV